MPTLSAHQSDITIEQLRQHFDRPIEIDQNGCWIWGGAVTTQGYPRLSSTQVHGRVLSLDKRPCMHDQEACHRCCVRICVNPNHLYPGTRKQNVQDSFYPGPRKLTDQDYDAICILYMQGWKKTEIGKLVGVSGEHVGKFLHGKLKHAKPSTTSE